MNFLQNENLCEKSNITKTGYRALFLLMQLLQRPLSREELIDIFEKDPIIKKDLSKDTITYTINTLRKAGCIISRPTVKTNHKYILKYHPFNIILTRSQVEALQTFREYVIANGNWQLLIHLNNLYAKIAVLAPDDETRNLLLYKHPFNDINLDVINSLILFIKTAKKATFIYNSPVNGHEELEFSPEYITFENQKLYVWGHNLKYDSFGYLRVDKIVSVESQLYQAPKASEDNFKKTIITVEYLLKGYSAQTFVCNEYEEVVERYIDKEYSIKIKALVSNKFNFYQRILSFGLDCKIIAPESAVKEFIRILKAIKAGYKDV